MKILFIGGTGTISMAITRLLAERGDELYLLNRGNRNGGLPENVKIISCDINDEKAAAEKLAGMEFDCVGEFIGFVPAQLERDFRLFAGKTKQFIYISSASAYRKPMQGYTITEETPLENPYWEYSRNKKACEEYLFERYRKDGFPVTVVRPSHTYDERSVPLGVHGANGSWQVVTAASCEQSGLRKKVCKSCGDTVTEEIPATGHKWATEYTVDKKPTKTEEGIESIHCTVCDAIKEGSERAIPPRAQEPQDLTIDPAAYTVVMGKTVDVTVTGAKGALTCEAEDPSMATATVSGTRITVKGEKTGTVKLIVKAAETADYEAGEAEFELNVVPGKTTRGDMFNLANNVKVTWLAVPGAKYYKVYRTGVTNPKESLSEPVIVTTGLVGWDKSPGLTNGNAYRYKIVASTTGAGDPSGDSPLSYSKLMYRLKTVVIRSVKNTAPGKVTVKYDRSTSGDSYVLQYCEREDMVGAKTKVVLGANNTSYVISGLKKGKTYYISIRVRKKVNGIDYYTTFGVAKKIKITQ